VRLFLRVNMRNAIGRRVAGGSCTDRTALLLGLKSGAGMAGFSLGGTMGRAGVPKAGLDEGMAGSENNCALDLANLRMGGVLDWGGSIVPAMNCNFGAADAVFVISPVWLKFVHANVVIAKFGRRDAIRRALRRVGTWAHGPPDVNFWKPQP